MNVCGVATVILSFSVDHGCDLRCRVVDGVLDAAATPVSARSAGPYRYRRVTAATRGSPRLVLGIRCVALVAERVGELAA